ncbi:MAG TPA: hypothetical protein VGM81_13755 [Burkholderiaceae bacterium]|jgi:hypothetical protein
MKAIQSSRLTALEEFASWFHQDFFVLFPNVQSGAAEYLAQLTDSQRHLLLSQLGLFVQANGRASEKAIRRAWFKLGAQAWPARGDTKALLASFLEQIR